MLLFAIAVRAETSANPGWRDVTLLASTQGNRPCDGD